MIKKSAFFILFFAWVSGVTCVTSLAGEGNMPALATLEPFTSNDRVLILAPHPDDEAIGCAGIIQQALAAGAQVKVSYLTNGDHNQIAFIVYEKRITLRKGEFIHMGEVRRKEAIKAMQLLGLSKHDLIFLGYPDFGTFTIFNQYWQAKRPFRSLLTRISAVPYKEDFSYRAPYVGESILNDLESVLLGYRPNKIFVSHPADTNVDHRALYLFLQVALGELDNKLVRPKAYSYLIHCLGWPRPRHFHPELFLDPPAKFRGNDNKFSWRSVVLTPEQIAKKRQAVLCYRSQTQSSAFYLLSFVRQNELFCENAAIELFRQYPEEESGVSFFGFSNMYVDSNTAEQEDMGARDVLVGDGVVSYALVDEALVIRVEKAKESVRRFSILLYLFGYSAKTPFAQMPKVRIIANQHGYKAYNGKKLINPSGVSLETIGNGVTIKVPLSVLGEPDYILTSMRTYGGILPVNTMGFRKVIIK